MLKYIIQLTISLLDDSLKTASKTGCYQYCDALDEWGFWFMKLLSLRVFKVQELVSEMKSELRCAEISTPRDLDKWIVIAWNNNTNFKDNILFSSCFHQEVNILDLNLLKPCCNFVKISSSDKHVI